MADGPAGEPCSPVTLCPPHNHEQQQAEDSLVKKASWWPVPSTQSRAAASGRQPGKEGKLVARAELRVDEGRRS